MQAAFYTRQGPAAEVFQVGEQPTPAPAAGEVRVRLRSSGVNPSDWKVRRGGMGRGLIAPLIIPHSDGAGQVDAVGEGVPKSRVGERVWLWNAQWQRAFGSAAQYIALPSAQAVRLPDHIGFAEGACFGIPALTAMQAVRQAEAGPGRTVLVAGGAGAVGHYAIQMAKERGATVLATVSSEAKAKLARDAGADHTINYKTENVGARVKEITGAGVDVVIEMDLAGNAKLYPEILKFGASVVVYGMSKLEPVLPGIWLMYNSIQIKFVFVYGLSDTDRREGIADLGRLLERNALKHNVALHVPLAEIARAHDVVEQGQVIGNVVLDIP